jgi:ankyrin repeat protein
VTSCFTFSALIKAAEKGYARIVEILLAYDADLYIANNAGMMALDFAQKNNHTSVLRLINDKMRTDSYLTLLLKEGKDIIPMLAGANLNSRDGHTALLFAIQKGDEMTAVALINGGVDVNQSYADGCAPIIKSSNYGYENIVRAILATPGVNVNKRSNNGNTALMKACEKGHFKIAEMLAKAGADFELHSNDGCCALIRACNYGHESIARLMVENGANINIKVIEIDNVMKIQLNVYDICIHFQSFRAEMETQD